jgi:putative transposase
MDLRDAIQRIALEWPSYGRPRITRELRRRGWTVNPKRVYRLLREDNLLCARKRKFVVTTDSNHGRKVYPNLAAGMVLTGVDQLWRADITYIRLREEFVFLAVILDAFSRRVIGWALDRTMEEELTLTALRMALKHRNVLPGLVHHSDRGSQYASNDYKDLLKASGIRISMSRKANPWDNAQCESFMKTLKYEEVLRNEYRDLARGTRLDPRVPGEGLQPETPALGAWLFAAGRVRGTTESSEYGGRCAAACRVSFSRHGESIHPTCELETGSRFGGPLPALIGTDESPAGYSLAGLRSRRARPPLHRPPSDCVTVVLTVENFPANGKQCLNRLSQPRGQPQIASCSQQIAGCISCEVWPKTEHLKKDELKVCFGIYILQSPARKPFGVNHIQVYF